MLLVVIIHDTDYSIIFFNCKFESCVLESWPFKEASEVGHALTPHTFTSSIVHTIILL